MSKVLRLMKSVMIAQAVFVINKNIFKIDNTQTFNTYYKVNYFFKLINNEFIKLFNNNSTYQMLFTPSKTVQLSILML